MRSSQGHSQGIQSVEIGGVLLRALLEKGSAMMLKDVAAAADMPAAKAHRYLASFIRMGIVEQDPVSGRYDLGPFALELGLGALARIDAVRLATQAISELSAELDVTAAVAVWGNRGPTVIRWEEPSRAVTVNLRTGAVMPLLSSAMGRCFAAYLPRTKYQALLNEELERANKSRNSSDPKTMRAYETVLAKVRETGVAAVQGTLIPGINALCAPVFDHRGQIAVTITLLGYEDTFDHALKGTINRALRRATHELTLRLGGPAMEEPRTHRKRASRSMIADD